MGDGHDSSRTVMITSNNQLIASVYYYKFDLRKCMVSSIAAVQTSSVPVSNTVNRTH